MTAQPHPFAGRRIGVVMGGLSAEREVSLNTGAGVLAGLQERGWDAIGIDWTAGSSLPHLLEAARVAVVWNALHGTFGEDGAVQGLCACLGIPCTGSGVLASSLAMDKIMSKRIFESNGVPTPTAAVRAATSGFGMARMRCALIAVARSLPPAMASCILQIALPSAGLFTWPADLSKA